MFLSTLKTSVALDTDIIAENFTGNTDALIHGGVVNFQARAGLAGQAETIFERSVIFNV